MVQLDNNHTQWPVRHLYRWKIDSFVQQAALQQGLIDELPDDYEPPVSGCGQLN